MGVLEDTVKALTPVIDFFAFRYRPACMLVIVCPLSYLLRVHLSRKERKLRALWPSGFSEHDKKVARVQEAIRRHQKVCAEDGGRKRMLCTARAGWQNLSTKFSEYKERSDCIFVGDMLNVLNLDAEKLEVTLEPLVEKGAITRFLVSQGYMLATTLEIEEATVGGLAMAVGMTTASHKYGLLQETVVEYEVVLGDGTLVKARRDNEYSDLWHALPWSHGSLGILVGLTMKVIPVKPYVRVQYDVHRSMAEYCNYVRELAHSEADFVEQTIFTRQEAVTMKCDFVDQVGKDGPLNHVLTWWKPFFYTHVRAFLERCRAQGKQSAVAVDYIPTLQYIFRHGPSIFWTMRDQLPEGLSNHPVIRFLFGWMYPPKVTFLKIPCTPKIKHEMMFGRVYQDIVLPIRTLEEQIKKAADLFEIWPILVYPSRIYDHGAGKRGIFPQPDEKDMVVLNGKRQNYAMYNDLGVYGTPKGALTSKYHHVHAMREMEDYTRSVKGAPFLYADTFMDRDEFSAMFNLGMYDLVRKKYGAEGNFPHLFDKTCGGNRVSVWQNEFQAETERMKGVA
eukprot:TRINITY_DN27457_c0_g1_i2.p1 TRINITY_DN27457_c0_g1~~TRINITY_DN27457_c0_g1_i2.p1  ORF type:complete len:562 (-),score=104.65 TRINITY_DN27457_c0_g1_i2:1003-2688(-)